MEKSDSNYLSNPNCSAKALELYKANIENLRTKLKEDKSSFLCPILCNNEINFYLPKQGKYVMYISDRYFIKRDINTKEIIKQHELPPELFPNQLKSITTNWNKTKLMILITRKRAAYLEIYIFDINTGQYRKIFIYEGKKRSLSLSKNQGFTDKLIYQSKRMGETTLKFFNLKTLRSSHLFCLDPNPESVKTYIPCMMNKLGFVFVLSFNSEEKHFKMNVYRFAKRKLVASFKVDHQINWYISQHNRLTVMHYDQFSVVFSVNVLLFFVDLKRKTCKVFSYFDRPIAGMVKKLSEDEEAPELGNLEVIEYDGFFIGVADEDFVFTYKNQLRRIPNGEIFYLSTSDVVNMRNGVKLSISNCSINKPILNYYCLGVNPYEFETVKMGDREILVSVKHREFHRNLILEVFKFNIETRERYCWRKNLGRQRGTKYNFLTFSEPNHHHIVIFYVKNGISLHFRIFDLLKNKMSESEKLIDDSGPMDVLKIDDDLNFIFNFRFTGIMMGNFKDVKNFNVIPETGHVFGTSMTQSGGGKIFYHLIDDFRRTRLEKVNLKHKPPLKEILFPDDRDFVDMRHFSNHTILSQRDDILLFYDCENRVKRSYRIPGITTIRKIMNFRKEGNIIQVTFTETTFNNVYDVLIVNDELVSITSDKMKYNSDRCLVYSKEKKYYQISDDHFYDMEQGKFLSPDYKGVLKNLFEKEVIDEESLGEVLKTIGHLGYKFSEYFGGGTVFEQIFEEYGDKNLLEMYKINFDIE